MVVSATRRRVTRGAKGAAGKAADSAGQVKRTGEDVRETAGGATESVGAAGLLDSAGREEGGSSEPQSIRQELASIVREAAIEVLAPVARQATKYAAKYAVQQGPKLAQRTLIPRIHDTLDSVADAGGAGAFAKEALGSVSGGGGVLSRLRGGDQEEENGRQAWQEAKAPIEEHVDLAIPLEEVYEHFQQFERHITFMSDHDQVDEVPNERIVWESANGLEGICLITFHELSDHLTRVMVTYEAHPHGLQKATTALRSPRRLLRNDLMHFKSLVEIHPDEVDALYEEPKAEEPEAEEDFEADEDEGAEDDEAQDGEPDQEEPKATTRRRAQPARSRSGEPARKAASEPRKRAVRSGSKASSARSGPKPSSGGARRQSQAASKSRPRARAKG